MPRMNLDLAALNDERRALQAVTAEQRAADGAVLRARSELDAAQRAGASAEAIARLQQAAANAQAARQRVSDRRREVEGRVNGAADVFVRGRDPSVLAQALDGQQPIALMPMRVETRYFPPQQATSLRIRVYPDDINTIEHTPAPTAGEMEAATLYWNARFRKDEPEAERIARDLASAYGRGRAAWVIRVTTPLNTGDADGETAPEFPALETIDARAKATRALLLPDRWCVIGYASGRREVFRAWGNRIPDELLLSPDWLAAGTPEPLLGGERSWLFDFAAAVENGMALEVTQQQVDAFTSQRRGPRFDLARDTLERLLVVGLEWTKDATQTAAELAELLSAQRDSQGFGFVPLGAPTNNTGATPSAYSVSEERAAPLSPSGSAKLPPEKDALELVSHAFGFTAGELAADNITNAHLPEQRTALHMMNVVWRGTLGQYLIELWNPPGDESDRILKTPTLNALRRYCNAYLRPAGPLPVLRVGTQPYGVLPVVGKAFTSTDSTIEAGIGKVLGVLRPMFEIASRKVPLLKDGNVERAKDILQTGPWSQTAFYRDKDGGKAMCKIPFEFGDAQSSGKGGVIRSLLNAFGIRDYWRVHLYNCNDFLPDPPYSAGYLAGTPWVLADDKNPKNEAPDASTFPPQKNYLTQIGNALSQTSAVGNRILQLHQSGPALLQALVAFSVQKEQGDAVESFAFSSNAVTRVKSLATPKMLYIEAAQQNEATFTVTSPKELARVSIPAVSGRATLGDHVAQSLSSQAINMQKGPATLAATRLVDSVGHLVKHVRDLGAVKLSLAYLAQRPIGELNIAFRTTLDAFSYRIDAWLTARATRRLEQLRAANPTGVYVGGYAWVENLKADARPDSEGYLLAPSLGQAATAAILRSGFMANDEQGAFNIMLDSKRTRRAEDILQGLTRDQPLAALYGYRVERSLRDASLGRFIWPLRLAYPWRPAGAAPSDEPKEAVGARDVVDGVALLAAWETDPNGVRARLATTLAGLAQPAPAPTNDEWAKVVAIVKDVVDLADSVSDLLMAEGIHQIVQGNFERAGAAMAIVDKQMLPIEPEVPRTPRGGASYTQRVALLCPTSDAGAWPQDRRSTVEPRLNAWLAFMLGDPSRYRFGARVQRGVAADGRPVFDAEGVSVGLDELALSALSAVLLATSVTSERAAGLADTGFRARVVAGLLSKIGDTSGVTGMEVEQEDPSGATLGLGAFEAIATTLRALIDRARPLTRKDIVVPENAIEAALPDEGEYPGVDVGEIEGRAAALIADFTALKTALDQSAGADALFANLAAMEDFLPRASWPQEVVAIDAPGSDPAQRDARATEALAALTRLTDARLDAVNAPTALAEGQAGPTHGQRVQRAIDQVKRLLGKDFPIVPQFSLGPYAAELGASLAEQNELTAGDPWQVTGWIPQLARVRDGLDRFAAALSAHEALVDVSGVSDFKLVQYPHRPGQVWAALPEAWRNDEGAVLDASQVPEELHEYLAAQPGASYKEIHRAAPNMALAMHAPGGLDGVAADTAIAGLLVDEWAEFIPDPFQTAAVGFHYDAPGARPPQSIILALPPRANQENWNFDEIVDVIHEARDLATLRAVRPRDLEGGLGLLLPANYLPQSYTDDLPSVQLLKLRRDAAQRIRTFADVSATIALGKI